jgi:hypothetical protein
MTALGMYVCGESEDITHLAMLFSRYRRHSLTFPHIHTRGQQYGDHPGQYCFFLPPFFLHTLPFVHTPCVDHGHGH